MSSTNRVRLPVLLAGATIATLFGCTVGPNYTPPRITVASQWPASPPVTTAPATQMSVATTRPANLAQWWTAFNDPELNSLVRRALAANLDLQQAQARLVQARAQRQVVAAGFWPTLDATGAYQRSHGHAAGTTSLYQSGFDAAWELDVFGGTRRNVESAEASIQAAVEDRRDVLVTVLGELASDYVTLRGLQRQLAITTENMTAQQRTADLTRQQFQGGFVSRLNSSNADAQVAATRSQIPTLQISAQQEIYAIAVLLGQDPASLSQELSKPAAVPPTPPSVPIGLPSDLLTRRPDIRRAEAQLHAATANVGAATAQLFPKFSLTGDIGLQGSKPLSLVNWSNGYWAVGPSVDWPIFNAGQIQANIRVQNALQQQALLAYQSTLLTALDETYSALVAYHNEQQRRSDLEQAVASSRQAVDLAMQLYRQGKTDFLNVLVAQQTLYANDAALAQSQTNVSVNLVALYKALGGGWD